MEQEVSDSNNPGTGSFWFEHSWDKKILILIILEKEVPDIYHLGTIIVSDSKHLGTVSFWF